MREMILAEDKAGRETALAKLLPMQRSDFKKLFEVMAGLPVTVRLLDPPLHEFLPHSDVEIEEVAKASGMDVEKLKTRAHSLKEVNPMLGHRGCRLGVSYPEIYEIAGARNYGSRLRNCQGERRKNNTGNYGASGGKTQRVEFAESQYRKKLRMLC